MTVTEVSREAGQYAGKSRMRLDTYVLISGLAAVALLGIARFSYEPSYQEKDRLTRAALAAEHTKVCDQLGKPADTPDRESCLKVLDALYTSHKETVLADSSEI